MDISHNCSYSPSGPNEVFAFKRSSTGAPGAHLTALYSNSAAPFSGSGLELHCQVLSSP